MKAQAVTIKHSTLLSAALVGVVFAVCSVNNARADLPPDVAAKVATYKKKLAEWAANPTVVAAAKESNAKGGLVPGMSNSKWDDLNENDPTVKGFQHSVAGKLVSKWEEDKAIDKLLVRDEKGNLVAGSTKPLLYNNANRAPFKNGLVGPWDENAVKPDPTTSKKTIQVSVPIIDGGKNIGVLQTAVVAD